PQVTAAMDLATSTSAYGDGFPNVIGEAMACGVPCVVSDLGDSAHLVNDTGLVVSPRDPSAFALAWGNFIEKNIQERKQLGDAARSRIQDNFSLTHVVSEYQSLYQGLVKLNYPQVHNQET
ncbi:MAG: glycosyltransferase, partial [Anaerolineaceae bacterium]|nr:glycosyltransferase [Anaerolineaceae bacterium]